MENNIHYLHGVIDTLKEIIQHNTNIKLSYTQQKLIFKNTHDDIEEIEEEIIEQSDINIIDKIDTAKNYIMLLDQMCQNRIKLLFKLEINKYIDLLKKNITDITQKLIQRGLDDKRINYLIKNKFLKSFETKFLLQYKFEDVSLTNEDILFLQEASVSRYNYNKYKIFNKEVFINHFLNYTISIFDISDMIQCVIQNKFCNLKYIPQSRSKIDDPYSFYFLEKIENDKFYWRMDCRLHNISNSIREHVIEYCINLFKNIYYQIFHDYTYRNNFETEKDILQFEGIQLLKNIHTLSCPYSFTKLFQSIIINTKLIDFPDNDRFKLNLKIDDTNQKNMYKDLKQNTDKQAEFSKILESIFTELNNNNIDEILVKII